ncbi:hypothetical protein BC831DRAFT_475449, partial [Entophlyctis helioformis]
MHITISSQTVRCDLDVEAEDSAEMLKVLVFSLQGISPDEQQLVFNGRILQDYQTLVSCGIRDGSAITMTTTSTSSASAEPSAAADAGASTAAAAATAAPQTLAESTPLPPTPSPTAAEPASGASSGSGAAESSSTGSGSGSAGSSPPVRAKGGRCNAPGCTSKAVKIVGECRHCALAYCSKHRLPESHACSAIQAVRQASHDRLAGKLMGESAWRPRSP